MNVDVLDPAFKNLLAVVQEDIRLHGLSDDDLIRECLRDELADDPRVVELMNRVKPGWERMDW